MNDWKEVARQAKRTFYMGVLLAIGFAIAVLIAACTNAMMYSF